MKIGVDIGGTFTDVVCQRQGQEMVVFKVPTTPADPGQAVLDAVDKLAMDYGLDIKDAERFVHGSTVATNAILERKGPKVALLTTAGFRDILDIGRQMRHNMYAYILKPEEPTFLAPGQYRFELDERVSSEGEVVKALDKEEARKVALELKEQGIKSVAICFLFSYLKPDHELQMATVIREVCPDIKISISSEVDPAFREYERTVVSLFDAYIKPVVDDYLSSLEAGLVEKGMQAPLQMMQSRGGVTTAKVARQRPVRLFLSGPAGGVEGARSIGSGAKESNIIAVDVGGTSSDISLIRDGKPVVKPEGLVAGYNIRVPMVDVNAIGSGGGSIAWLDSANGLRVGPESAGSVPGPACYGRGGKQATVTDASIVLGYLDPNYFAGGSLSLNPDLAHDVIKETLAKPLGISAHEAALGIHSVVNAQMAEGIRLVSIRQGYDPREFALLPLGGAGGVHACALAEELGIKKILIAPHPGVLSAVGLLCSKIEHEISAAMPMPVVDLNIAELKERYAGIDAECAELMRHENVDSDRIEVSYYADVCYIGQSHYLEIPIEFDGKESESIEARFREAHKRVFGHATDSPITIVNIRSVHTVTAERAVPTSVKSTSGNAEKGSRTIHLLDKNEYTAKVIDRSHLAPGDSFCGPAILDQSDTTTLIYPGWKAEVLVTGTIQLTRSEGV